MSGPILREYDKLLAGALWFSISVAALPAVIVIVVAVIQAAR